MYALKPYMQLCIWYPFRMGSGMPPQSRVSRACSLASCVLSMASEPLGGETWWQNKGRLLKLMLASGLVLNFCFRSAVWEVSPPQVLVAGNSTMPSGSRETVLSKTMGQWFGEIDGSAVENAYCACRGAKFASKDPPMRIWHPLGITWTSACVCSQSHTDSKHLHNSVFLILKNVSQAVSPPLGCVC